MWFLKRQFNNACNKVLRYTMLEEMAGPEQSYRKLRN